MKDDLSSELGTKPPLGVALAFALGALACLAASIFSFGASPPLVPTMALGWTPLGFLCGGLALLIGAGAQDDLAAAVRREYLVVATPIGALFALFFAFSSATGRVGGGSTVTSEGAHVSHHKEVSVQGATQALFVLVYLIAGVSSAYGWFTFARAFGVTSFAPS